MTSSGLLLYIANERATYPLREACRTQLRIIAAEIEAKDAEIARLREACELTVKALGGTCDSTDCDQCEAYEASAAALAGKEPTETAEE